MQTESCDQLIPVLISSSSSNEYYGGGVLKSPNFPFEYSNNLNCTYTFLFESERKKKTLTNIDFKINYTSDKKICFLTRQFNLEKNDTYCLFDYLKVGTPENNYKYCGNGIWQMGLYDPDFKYSSIWGDDLCWSIGTLDFFEVQFITDNKVTASGFFIEFSIIDEDKRVSSPSDSVSLPFLQLVDCLADQYRCFNRECIPLGSQASSPTCDEITQCSDYSDEDLFLHHCPHKQDMRACDFSSGLCDLKISEMSIVTTPSSFLSSPPSSLTTSFSASSLNEKKSLRTTSSVSWFESSLKTLSSLYLSSFPSTSSFVPTRPSFYCLKLVYRFYMEDEDTSEIKIYTTKNKKKPEHTLIIDNNKTDNKKQNKNNKLIHQNNKIWNKLELMLQDINEIQLFVNVSTSSSTSRSSYNSPPWIEFGWISLLEGICENAEVSCFFSSSLCGWTSLQSSSWKLLQTEKGNFGHLVLGEEVGHQLIKSPVVISSSSSSLFFASVLSTSEPSASFYSITKIHKLQVKYLKKINSPQGFCSLKIIIINLKNNNNNDKKDEMDILHIDNDKTNKWKTINISVENEGPFQFSIKVEGLKYDVFFELISHQIINKNKLIKEDNKSSNNVTLFPSFSSLPYSSTFSSISSSDVFITPRISNDKCSKNQKFCIISSENKINNNDEDNFYCVQNDKTCDASNKCEGDNCPTTSNQLSIGEIIGIIIVGILFIIILIIICIVIYFFFSSKKYNKKSTSSSSSSSVISQIFKLPSKFTNNNIAYNNNHGHGVNNNNNNNNDNIHNSNNSNNNFTEAPAYFQKQISATSTTGLFSIQPKFNNNKNNNINNKSPDLGVNCNNITESISPNSGDSFQRQLKYNNTTSNNTSNNINNLNTNINNNNNNNNNINQINNINPFSFSDSEETLDFPAYGQQFIFSTNKNTQFKNLNNNFNNINNNPNQNFSNVNNHRQFFQLKPLEHIYEEPKTGRPNKTDQASPSSSFSYICNNIFSPISFDNNPKNPVSNLNKNPNNWNEHQDMDDNVPIEVLSTLSTTYRSQSRMMNSFLNNNSIKNYNNTNNSFMDKTNNLNQTMSPNCDYYEENNHFNNNNDQIIDFNNEKKFSKTTKYNNYDYNQNKNIHPQTIKPHLHNHPNNYINTNIKSKQININPSQYILANSKNKSPSPTITNNMNNNNLKQQQLSNQNNDDDDVIKFSDVQTKATCV